MDEFRNGEDIEKPAPPGGKKVATPTFRHFYVLLGLLILLLLGLAAGMYHLKSADSKFEIDLTNVGRAFREAQEAQGRTLSDRITQLESRLDATMKKLEAVSKSLDDTRAELVEFRTKAQTSLADLGKGLEDQAKALTDGKQELNRRIEETRSAFETKQAETETVVKQLKSDAEFIISELGKKAEKAYLLFMERKLKKEISAVSDKVDTVKTELEEEIFSTHRRIEEVAGGLGETIKKHVEERVKIEFVPSATAEEE